MRAYAHARTPTCMRPDVHARRCARAAPLLRPGRTRAPATPPGPWRFAFIPLLVIVSPRPCAPRPRFASSSAPLHLSLALHGRLAPSPRARRPRPSAPCAPRVPAPPVRRFVSASAVARALAPPAARDAKTQSSVGVGDAGARSRFAQKQRHPGGGDTGGAADAPPPHSPEVVAPTVFSREGARPAGRRDVPRQMLVCDWRAGDGAAAQEARAERERGANKVEAGRARQRHAAGRGVERSALQGGCARLEKTDKALSGGARAREGFGTKRCEE